jgi:hypothetical protein
MSSCADVGFPGGSCSRSSLAVHRRTTSPYRVASAVAASPGQNPARIIHQDGTCNGPPAARWIGANLGLGASRHRDIALGASIGRSVSHDRPVRTSSHESRTGHAQRSSSRGSIRPLPPALRSMRTPTTMRLSLREGSASPRLGPRLSDVAGNGLFPSERAGYEGGNAPALGGAL